MSLATLKKKTQHKYKNNTGKQSQFSINGGYRNQGYVGQTSLSRHIIHTPHYGPDPQGHGTCCGSYNVNIVAPSSACSTEDNETVKSSVLGTKGMLAKRTAWSRRPAPFASVTSSQWLNQKSSSDYMVYKRKQALKSCELSSDDSSLGKESLAKCESIGIKTKCSTTFKENGDVHTSMTQGDYIFKITDKCGKLDEDYIRSDQNINGKPIPTG